MKKFLSRLADSTAYVMVTAIGSCVALIASVFSVSICMLNVCLIVFVVLFFLALFPFVAE